MLDRTALLGDVLRACMVLAINIKAVQLRDWAKAELQGYPGFEVPDYRKIRAPIMQIVQDAFGRNGTYPFDPSGLPAEIREHLNEIVPLNQSVDGLEALVAEAEANHRQIELEVFAAPAYRQIWNKRPDRTYGIVALYWTISPSVIRGALGQIRSVLAEFAAELRAEVGGGGHPPSAAQAVNLLRNLVGPAVINNLNIYTDHAQSGGIVTNQPTSQYNFGGVAGNVAAGSSGFSQTYNENAFDTGQLRDFADFVLQIAGALGLEPDGQAELVANAKELQAAAEDPAGGKGRWRKALDAVISPLKLAMRTAARDTAIAMGDQLSTDLQGYIHHLPHP